MQVVVCLGLTAAAIGVHFAWNVPPGEIRESVRDQGVSKPKAKKRKVRAAKDGRSVVDHQQAWRKHRAQAFEAEPVDAAWARDARSLVHHSVTVARKQAFEGALEQPQVTASNIECRTVRCRFELRTPYPHELDLLLGALRNLRAGTSTLWRDFEVTTPGDELREDGEANAGEAAGMQHAVVVTAAPRLPRVKTSSIRVAEGDGAANDEKGGAAPQPSARRRAPAR